MTRTVFSTMSFDPVALRSGWTAIAYCGIGRNGLLRAWGWPRAGEQLFELFPAVLLDASVTQQANKMPVRSARSCENGSSGRVSGIENNFHTRKGSRLLGWQVSGPDQLSQRDFRRHSSSAPGFLT